MTVWAWFGWSTVYDPIVKCLFAVILGSGCAFSFPSQTNRLSPSLLRVTMLMWMRLP